jgi:hypothetical protein
MTTCYSRGVIWFNRLVLVGGTFVMSMIALRNLRDLSVLLSPSACFAGRPSQAPLAGQGVTVRFPR